MGLVDAIRKSFRRKRVRRAATRIAVDQSTAVLRRLDALAVQEHVDRVRQQAVGRNPLLAYGYKVFSQNDEDGIIEHLIGRMGLREPGGFLELGVGDGTENNTLNLLLNGWAGAWLGGEALKIETPTDKLQFERCWIDRDNVVDLARKALSAKGVVQPDLVSVDLDGNDYHINKALLEGGFKPAVWVAEYNARFAPLTDWVMPYDSKHEWDGSDYSGASLAALVDLFVRHGYRLVGCNVNGVNAFFVSEWFADAFRDVPTDLLSLFMPADRHPFPYAGPPPSLRLIRNAAAGGSRSRDESPGVENGTAGANDVKFAVPGGIK
jgi:hypothetical protein